MVSAWLTLRAGRVVRRICATLVRCCRRSAASWVRRADTCACTRASFVWCVASARGARATRIATAHAAARARVVPSVMVLRVRRASQSGWDLAGGAGRGVRAARRRRGDGLSGGEGGRQSDHPRKRSLRRQASRVHQPCVDDRGRRGKSVRRSADGERRGGGGGPAPPPPTPPRPRGGGGGGGGGPPPHANTEAEPRATRRWRGTRSRTRAWRSARRVTRRCQGHTARRSSESSAARRRPRRVSVRPGDSRAG